MPPSSASLIVLVLVVVLVLDLCLLHVSGISRSVLSGSAFFDAKTALTLRSKTEDENDDEDEDDFGARGPLLHPGKCLFQQFEIAGVTQLRARRFDPFSLERVLGGAIAFKENTKYAGKGLVSQPIRRNLVGYIVTSLVLRSAVPLFFVY